MDTLATSWATTHRSDDGISRDATLHGPFLENLKINRVGQFHRGLIGRLAESRSTQHVNYFLLAVVHDNPLATELNGYYRRA